MGNIHDLALEFIGTFYKGYSPSYCSKIFRSNRHCYKESSNYITIYIKKI